MFRKVQKMENKSFLEDTLRAFAALREIKKAPSEKI